MGGSIMKKTYNMGIDVGSTTVKTVILDRDEIIFKEYRRHFSDVKKAVKEILQDVYKKLGDINISVVVTGSGGMDISNYLNLKFVQEVISSTKAIETYNPETDVVIELGGEDAKITYLSGGIDQRMNGICAGGTGAFIDQMATLLKTDASGLNEMAKDYKVIYPIASRCGVFAKTDIQPLINEGAAKEDIAASIFQAVVNQTISGLACGRPIRGNVAFLGGPLTYIPELRKRFVETLNLTPEQTIVPEEAHLLVAKGACLDAKDMTPISVEKLKSKIQVLRQSHDTTTQPLQPLFKTNIEYDEFKVGKYDEKLKNDMAENIILDKNEYKTIANIKKL